MVGSTSFMTLRSNLGMAKHIVKVAKHLRKAIMATARQRKAFKDAIAQGSVEGVNKSWAAFIANLTEQEREMNDIIRSEEIELRNEEKLEVKVKNLMTKLSPEDKAKLDDFSKALEKTVADLKIATKAMMVELRRVFRNKEGLMAFRTRKSDPRIAKIMVKLAKRERKTISLQEKDFKIIDFLFGKLIPRFYIQVSKTIQVNYPAYIL